MRGRDRKLQQAPPKAPDRLEVLKVIEQLEREGRFDVDAEEDPPTIPLLPDMVDYLKVKPDSIFKRKTAYLIAGRFVDRLIREKKLVIRKVYGMEHLNQLSTGAVITCNHFNPFDCFTVEWLFQQSEHTVKKDCLR